MTTNAYPNQYTPTRDFRKSHMTCSNCGRKYSVHYKIKGAMKCTSLPGCSTFFKWDDTYTDVTGTKYGYIDMHDVARYMPGLSASYLQNKTNSEDDRNPNIAFRIKKKRALLKRLKNDS